MVSDVGRTGGELTPREQAVLAAVGRRLNNAEIAAELFVSVRTVESHIAALRRVPFLFVRQGVISDWKFFLDKDDWLNMWARRFEESAVPALAQELRRLPWRARRD